MAVSLVKGQKTNLSKISGTTLTKLTVGLGWDAKSAFTAGHEFDLDAVALVVDEAGRVLNDSYFVFFGNLKTPDGSVEHTGDNLTGDAEGDDEQLLVDLTTLPANAKKIIFAVNIYEAVERGQNFGQVDNAYIHATDQNGTELVRYDLDMEASLESLVVFGEVIRNGSDWAFAAVGNGYPQGLAGLARQYGVNVG